MSDVIHDPQTTNGESQSVSNQSEPQVIHDPYKNYENLEQAEKPSTKNINIFTKTLLFFTLGLAIMVDIAGIIATLIDVGTMGIGGWIIRIIFGLFKIIYLGFFWYLSSAFDFNEGKTTNKEIIKKIGRSSKIFIWLTRSLGATSLITGFVPIIGSLIDALPIETFNVIFLFFIFPKITGGRR